MKLEDVGRGYSFKQDVRVPEKVRDLNKKNERGSHTDTWSKTLQQRGRQQVQKPRGRKWLSLDDSLCQCGWNGVSKGDISRANGQTDCGGPCFGPGSSEKFLFTGAPLTHRLLEVTFNTIGCRKSQPAYGRLLRCGRQQSRRGLLLKFPAHQAADVYGFLENPENSEGTPSGTRQWNVIWLHLSSAFGAHLSVTFSHPQRQHWRCTYDIEYFGCCRWKKTKIYVLKTW